MKVEYYTVPGTVTNDATLKLYLKQDSGFDWTSDWSQYLKPGYGLTSGSVVSDAQVGDVETETEYQNPSYGILDEVTVDPSGVAVKNSSTTEYQNAGYFRQLASTSNGGVTSQLSYWGSTATADNPCTTEIETYKQAGRLKSTVDVDPDGSGSETPLVTSNIYDDAGRIVADRIGDEAWTCMSYDSRGRLVEVDVPTVGSRTGRTVTYDYVYNSNPLSTEVTDSNGSTVETVDLLGRSTEFIDAWGNSTQAYYTDIGQLHERTSKLGYEVFNYDSYGRLTSYDLENSTLADITYDANGRVSEVEYPSIKDPNTNQTLTMDTFTRDSLERLTGFQYTLPDNSQISNAVSLSQSGIVLDESVNGVDLSPGVNGFEYDKAGRLTKANVAGHTYEYGFGQPNSACSNYSTSFDGAGDNYNRTSYKIDGAAEWYCYDSADKLIASSENRFHAPTYDNHGNTLTLGSSGNQTTFVYDQSDRNISIEEGSNKVEYLRDHDGRIVKRDVTTGGSTASYYYGFTGAGSQSFMYTNNTTKDVEEMYLLLPGGASLTIRPNETTQADKTKVSLQNLHGDTITTLDGEGVDETGILIYEPFGTQISATSSFANANSTQSYASASVTPDSRSDSQSATWASAFDVKIESLFSVNPVQMGERVYIPGLGRFIQVDPVDGGTLNPYAYALDPVNSSDYSGEFLGIANAIRTIVAVAIEIYRAVKPIYNAVKNFVVKKSAKQAPKPTTPKATGSSSKSTTSSSKSGANKTKPSEIPKHRYNGPAFRSSLSLGRAAHNAFGKVAENMRAGVTLNKRLPGSKLRPDAYDPSEGGIVRELKPANQRGVNDGIKQLTQYMKACGEGCKKAELWLYRQNSDGTFKYWREFYF